MRISDKLKMVAGAVAALAGMALFTNAQVNKAAYLHELNALHFKYATQLTDLLRSKAPLSNENTLRQIETAIRSVRKQPESCLAKVTPLDRAIMSFIGTSEIIAMCQHDIVIADEALGAISRYRSGELTPAALSETLEQANDVFMHNSFAFIAPVEQTGDFIVRLMGAVSLLMSCAVGGLVLLTARSVSQPLQELSASVEALKRGDAVERIAAAERDDELGALAKALDGLHHLARQLSKSQAALETTNTALLAERESLERRVAERTADLQEALIAAEEASAAKSRFLAAMSHELRTPLNAIIGYSEMLREEAYSEARAQDVADHDRVLRAAQHLLRLINDVLDLAKVEAGKLYLEYTEFELRDLLEDALDSVRPQAEANGDRLRLSVGAAPRRVRTDVVKLRQALLNLLSNAVKFTRDGEVALEVWAEGGMLHLEVADTGCGIAPEVLKRLFHPFEQADASSTRRHDGTGLGLAITKRFAQALGGDVTAESQPGEGSRFRLSVALDAAAAQAA